MFNLILKDILVQKRALLFNFAYSLFVLILFQNPVFSATSYIMGAVAVSYMLILGAVAYDDKNKSDIILNNLPLKRATIVGAKYASAMVFAALALLNIGLLGTIMKGVGLPVPLRYIHPGDILGTVASIGLLSTLYYPVYFRFGYIRSRFFNIVLFMLAFFLPPLTINYVKENYSQESINQVFSLISGQPWVAGGIMLVALTVLMLASCFLSLALYRRREF